MDPPEDIHTCSQHTHASINEQPLKHLVELLQCRPQSVQANLTLRSMNDSHRHHPSIAAHRTWKIPLLQQGAVFAANNRYPGYSSGLVTNLRQCHKFDPEVKHNRVEIGNLPEQKWHQLLRVLFFKRYQRLRAPCVNGCPIREYARRFHTIVVEAAQNVFTNKKEAAPNTHRGRHLTPRLYRSAAYEERSLVGSLTADMLTCSPTCVRCPCGVRCVRAWRGGGALLWQHLL